MSFRGHKVRVIFREHRGELVIFRENRGELVIFRVHREELAIFRGQSGVCDF